MSVLTYPVSTPARTVGATLEQVRRLVDAADRADLVDRVAAVRSWLADRRLRIAVTGTRDADVDGVLRSLRAVSAHWLPRASSYLDQGHYEYSVGPGLQRS